MREFEKKIRHCHIVDFIALKEMTRGGGGGGGNPQMTLLIWNDLEQERRTPVR